MCMYDIISYPQICQSECERRCDERPTTSIILEKITTPQSVENSAECYPGSPDPICQHATHENWCKSSKNHPKCKKNEVKLTSEECFDGSANPNCFKVKSPCELGSLDPKCKKFQISIEQCTEGSNDPRCANKIGKSSSCAPGSRSPHCISRGKSVSNCVLGSNDPRCNQGAIHSDCRPGSRDPNCAPDQQLINEVFDCVQFPGDPRCITKNTITEICFPGSTHPSCRSKQEEIPIDKQTKCTLNSNDPNCPGVTVFKIPGINIEIPNTPIQILCPLGSTDPICNMPPQTLNCILNPDDPKCFVPITTQSSISSEKCQFGSLDPKCTQSHRESTFQTKPTSKPSTPITTTPFEETPVPVLCDRSSNNPNCPQVVQLSIGELFCEPNSNDPRCPDHTRIPKVPIPQIINKHRTNEVILQPPRVPSIQEAEVIITSFTCTAESRDPRCKHVARVDCSVDPSNARCRDLILESTSVRSPTKSVNPPVNCELQPKHPRCKPPVTIAPETPLLCALDPFNSQCRQKIESCASGSNSKNCVDSKRSRPSSKSRGKSLCNANNNDPRCRKEIISEVPSVKPKPFECTPLSNDPRCQVPRRTISEKTVKIENTKDKKISNDDFDFNDCLQIPNQPKCLSGPTVPPTRCHIGSTDPACKQTPPIECIFGSRKPQCHNLSRERVSPPVTPKQRFRDRTQAIEVTTEFTSITKAVTPIAITKAPFIENFPKQTISSKPRVPENNIPATKPQIITDEKPVFPPKIITTRPKPTSSRKRIPSLEVKKETSAKIIPPRKVNVPPSFPPSLIIPAKPFKVVTPSRKVPVKSEISKGKQLIEFISTEKPSQIITHTPQFPPKFPPRIPKRLPKRPSIKTFRTTPPRPFTRKPKVVTTEESPFPPFPDTSTIPPERPRQPIIPIPFVPTVPANSQVTTEASVKENWNANKEKQIDVPHFSIESRRTTTSYRPQISRKPLVVTEPYKTSRYTTSKPLRTTSRSKTRFTVPYPETSKSPRNKVQIKRPSESKEIGIEREIERRPISREKVSPQYSPRLTASTQRRPTTSQKRPSLERGESKVSTHRPISRLSTERPPRPSKVMMHGKDDHHGKGMDPRYHAFHSCKFLPYNCFVIILCICSYFFAD